MYVSGITFIRYAQNLKIGITFIRYAQNLKIGITFIRYVSGITFIRYVSGITFIRYAQALKIGKPSNIKVLGGTNAKGINRIAKIS